MKMPLLLLSLAIVVALSVFLFIRSRQAYGQQIGFVTIRQPGDRLLGPPEPASSEASIDVIPAFVSQAAYQRRPPDPNATKDDRDKNIPWMDPDQTLCKLGWKKWPDLLDSDTAKQLTDVHLRRGMV
jgi:hypothetical protein